jgi:hypothetical protein
LPPAWPTYGTGARQCQPSRPPHATTLHHSGNILGSYGVWVTGSVFFDPHSTHVGAMLTCTAERPASLAMRTRCYHPQGEEATVVLLSTVRCNEDGHIGFLSHRNRVNVMLSRARHGMVILGSAATLRASAAQAAQRSGRGGGAATGGGAAMWGEVLGMLEREGRVGRCLRVRCGNHGTDTEIGEPEDFMRLAGDGGCQLPCGEALSCGHSCPR